MTADPLPFGAAIDALGDRAMRARLRSLFPDRPETEMAFASAGTIGFGLFTPNAQFDPAVVALIGEETPSGIRVSGRVMTSNRQAAATIAPVRMGERVHLALISPDRAAADPSHLEHPSGPAYLDFDRHHLGVGRLSRSLNWPKDEAVVAALDAWSVATAGLVATSCGAGLRELRRRLAECRTPNGVASQSQLVSHDVTKLEIEISLLGDASAHPRSEPWLLLCAAARCQERFVGLVESLERELGFAWHDDGTPWPTRADLGHMGGRRMIEGVDAHRRGLDAAGGRP
ncbi:hypothetical protein [Jiella pacifica]|uniref:Uncharacterized protein n=1 Tax=Jiella pacifica TaxID=2696469 RepID=A0A6N9T3R1_9HYPH|nr:hypothetical protein [Jiella pacifica]NDW06017.1 hypothetical protein [Jiella pacifica]